MVHVSFVSEDWCRCGTSYVHSWIFLITGFVVFVLTACMLGYGVIPLFVKTSNDTNSTCLKTFYIIDLIVALICTMGFLILIYSSMYECHHFDMLTFCTIVTSLFITTKTFVNIVMFLIVARHFNQSIVPLKQWQFYLIINFQFGISITFILLSIFNIIFFNKTFNMNILKLFFMCWCMGFSLIILYIDIVKTNKVIRRKQMDQIPQPIIHYTTIYFIVTIQSIVSSLILIIITFLTHYIELNSIRILSMIDIFINQFGLIAQFLDPNTSLLQCYLPFINSLKIFLFPDIEDNDMHESDSEDVEEEKNDNSNAIKTESTTPLSTKMAPTHTSKISKEWTRTPTELLHRTSRIYSCTMCPVQNCNFCFCCS